MVGIKFGGWAPDRHCKNIDGFKFGSSVRDRHTYTIFIRIVAVATINFSLAWVRLLIEGSSYSRAAFINFGPTLNGVIHKNCSTEG